MLTPVNPNAFANSPLDRAAHHRRDRLWLAHALASDATKLIPFHQHRPFVTEEAGVVALGWLGGHAREAIASPDAPLVFLGVDVDEAPYFAISIADPAPLETIGRFEELRPLAPRLSWTDLPPIGCAKAIFEWHARNGYCANCGGRTEIVEAGWKRQCPGCSAEHFPRVDPVAIMLPTFGDKCLLGRQRMWPRGMHSALAGFIEPGETIEEGAARETLEEAGLRARDVRLHSSQPWPFPHSLMIGAIIEVEDDRETIDTNELETGRWFTRAEAQQLIAGKHPDAFAPPPYAIAHQLLKTWAAG